MPPFKNFDKIDKNTPVLIAGQTASGKSQIAMVIAENQGGIIINADAIQVYKNWRILTARPSSVDEAKIKHKLYGHIDGAKDYLEKNFKRQNFYCRIIRNGRQRHTKIIFKVWLWC